jgi:hypothetical protein
VERVRDNELDEVVRAALDPEVAGRVKSGAQLKAMRDGW